MKPISKSLGSAALLLVVAVMVAAGCQRATAPPPPPPSAVTVSQPLEREVIRWNDYSAYLASPETVDVKARVSGLIEEAPFREGALIHKGDLLFKIDPRPFQADLDNKEAAVAQAKATVDQTRAQYQRDLTLSRLQVISTEEYDNAKAAYQEAAASLNAAEAALETSRLNLEWTEVRAPISGRISRIDVTVGNLVNGGSGQGTTILTTIVSIDPLYTYINVPQDIALRYQQLALENTERNVAGAKVPCFLKLEDETQYDHQGVIDFIDNQVDVNTGTVQMRCVVPNPTALLIPGLFAVTRIPASGRYRALLVPDSALNADQNERYLLIVGPNDIVERRPVTRGALFGNLRAIDQGLKPGEKVIVSGLQMAFPGSRVRPQEVPISAPSQLVLDGMGEHRIMAAQLPQMEPMTNPATHRSTEARP
jgi:membrane fusion protein, multidrug efflux system